MRASRAKAVAKSTGRSAITNGSTLMPGIDGRSLYARRFRDLIDLHSADLGGADRLSQAEQSLVRRAATLTIQCEQLEARFAEIETPATIADLDAFQRMSNTLRRLLTTLGTKRRQKTVPNLNEYLASQPSRHRQRILEHGD